MSINKVILIGNVGQDPQVRYLENGVCTATFSLATTERGYTDRNGTQWPDRTEWHNLVLWRGLAETAEKYVRKGSQLYIEGKIRTRNYDDANGQKRYVTEISVDNMQLLGRREQSEGGAQAGNNPAPQVAAPQQAQPAINPYAAAATENQGSTEANDDLPF